MADKDAGYERMKRLLGIAATEVLGIAADNHLHPLRALADIEANGRTDSRKGLQIAINDIVEMCDTLPKSDVERLDGRLVAADAMTLSEARARFSKKLKTVLSRGRINNETEYYLARNAADLAEPEIAERLWAMLHAFEQSISDAT